MRLRILAVGKLKQPGLESLVSDYIKRARSLLPIELCHLRDLAALRSRAQPSQTGPRVVLDERGEQITSETLAAWLSTWQSTGARQVDFLIGDAHGFNDNDRQSAARVMALSKMTLPHRLAQVLLVEQLYRAGTILANHPYHH
ncbi:LSU m3Psi1915 methyltransferase RlmH [Enhygromyxa salina]|uniref:Ribosomal RNA large subunit methyltransferase H n=1 Tax=Enhygromyxa salina TaxID=215803 RepID=A0A0C2D3I5_9BACT|nr:23S rRNA (pseudouridine(1915)-N(3))-methyltransferase RlmH [Enhygromyxa salina]KIG16295.1 LSU m3Psi1915 methyltransferase RlmH [Enhygromyxa salina]